MHKPLVWEQKCLWIHNFLSLMIMSPLADISGYKLQTGAHTGKISCSLWLPKEPIQDWRKPAISLSRHTWSLFPSGLSLAAWGNEISSQPLLAEGHGADPVSTQQALLETSQPDLIQGWLILSSSLSHLIPWGRDKAWGEMRSCSVTCKC